MTRAHWIGVTAASVALTTAAFVSPGVLAVVATWVALAAVVDHVLSVRRAERALAEQAERDRLAALPVVQPLWLCPVCDRPTTPLVVPTEDGRDYRYECLRCEYRWTGESERRDAQWGGGIGPTSGSSRTCRSGSRNGKHSR